MKRPPLTNRTQTFHFMAAIFHVDYALQLVEKRPVAGTTDPREFLKSYIRTGVVGVREQYAMSEAVDITKPIVMAHLFRKEGNKHVSIGLLPIDGWHRIYKAVMLGKDTIEYKALTEVESRRVRIL